jgi:hypothetical protein
MRHSFNRAIGITYLAAAILLSACSAKPPMPIAEFSQKAVESLPVPQTAMVDLVRPAEKLIPDATPEPLQPFTPKTIFESERSTRRLLRWKFAAEDVIRYETLLVEYLTLNGEELRNERSVRYRWTIFYVSDEGFASILVTVERVSLNLKQPPFQFDSDKDRSNIEPGASGRLHPELQAARNLLGADLVVTAGPCGNETVVVGSESLSGYWKCLRLTPADFPALPDDPVGSEDSWRVPLIIGTPATQPFGQIDCLLKSEQSIGRRAVDVIESCTTMVLPAVVATGAVRPVSSVAVSRFDREAGLFLSGTTKGTYTVTTDAGQQMQRDYEVKRQLLPTIANKEWSPQRLIEARFPQTKGIPFEHADNPPTSGDEKAKPSPKREAPLSDRTRGTFSLE